MMESDLDTVQITLPKLAETFSETSLFFCLHYLPVDFTPAFVHCIYAKLKDAGYLLVAKVGAGEKQDLRFRLVEIGVFVLNGGVHVGVNAFDGGQSGLKLVAFLVVDSVNQHAPFFLEVIGCFRDMVGSNDEVQLP